MKHFKNVKSFDDLKKQYRELAKKNHPDAGGSKEVFQEISIEFDVLFKIWKNRVEKETGKKVNETSASVKRTFYTQNGWEGSRYDSSLSTTDISKAIRSYCKEMYPTWKFSVTSQYFSGGSSITLCVMESPVDIFDREYFKRPFRSDCYSYGRSDYYRNDCWSNFNEMTENNSYYMQLHNMDGNRDYYEYLNDIGYEVLRDVYSFAQSYNYDDSDGMIDYFDTNFYLHFEIGKWNKGFKVVPKTARIKAKKCEVSATTEQPKKEESKTNEYQVKEDVDTRDNSKIYVVKIVNTLTKEEYSEERNKMKELGGYYSRFKHGFIFKDDPTDKLNVA